MKEPKLAVVRLNAENIINIIQGCPISYMTDDMTMITIQAEDEQVEDQLEEYFRKTEE